MVQIALLALASGPHQSLLGLHLGDQLLPALAPPLVSGEGGCEHHSEIDVAEEVVGREDVEAHAVLRPVAAGALVAAALVLGHGPADVHLCMLRQKLRRLVHSVHAAASLRRA